MLSSHKTHYAWSKQDRERDVSFFGTMAQRWRPTVHPHDAESSTIIKSRSDQPEGDVTGPGWNDMQMVD